MTKPRNDITNDAVAELLRYDPDTGKLHWVVSRGRVKAGDEAGSHQHGYIYIRINSRRYKAHRLAWVLTYGEWPKHQIDHINGDKADNRISNLRSLTHQENARAFRKPSFGVSSKYRGVSWDKRAGKWRAYIMNDLKLKYLGGFECELEAARAYDTAAEGLGFSEEALNRTHHPEVGE